MVSDNNSTRPYRPSSTVFPERPLLSSEDPLATRAFGGELLLRAEVRIPKNRNTRLVPLACVWHC